MSQTTVELRGCSYSGTVTDMDALFVAGLLLPNYFDIRDKEHDLRRSFDEFSSRNAEALQQDANSAEEMYEIWGERLLIRLTNNLDIRAAFAQRMLEIFPTLDASLVKFDRWRDRENNIHEHASIRLNMDEAMTLVVAIVGTLKPQPTPEAPKAKSNPKGFAKPVSPAVKDVEPVTIEQLQARIKELEAAAP